MRTPSSNQLLILQISAELQQILGKPVDKKWEDVLPKIFKAAELHKRNTYEPSLSQEECSEGEFRLTMATFQIRVVFKCVLVFIFLTCRVKNIPGASDAHISTAGH